MTDEEFNRLLVKTLKSIVPTVREGVYTGEDCDRYITFVYYVRGIQNANDRPTAKKWQVTVTYWARYGIRTYDDRLRLCEAIEKMCGAYPSCETSTDDGWQQYVYEFGVFGGIEEWQG